jgi:hypothetical protein
LVFLGSVTYCSPLATVALRPRLIWGPGDNHLLPRLHGAGEVRPAPPHRRAIEPGGHRVHRQRSGNTSCSPQHTPPRSRVRRQASSSRTANHYQLWDMVNQMLAAAQGCPPVTRTVPVSVALALASSFRPRCRVTGSTSELQLTRFMAREMSTAHWFDISAARRDSRWVPCHRGRFATTRSPFEARSLMLPGWQTLFAPRPLATRALCLQLDGPAFPLWFASANSADLKELSPANFLTAAEQARGERVQVWPTTREFHTGPAGGEAGIDRGSGRTPPTLPSFLTLDGSLKKKKPLRGSYAPLTSTTVNVASRWSCW